MHPISDIHFIQNDSKKWRRKSDCQSRSYIRATREAEKSPKWRSLNSSDVATFFIRSGFSLAGCCDDCTNVAWDKRNVFFLLRLFFSVVCEWMHFGFIFRQFIDAYVLGKEQHSCMCVVWVCEWVWTLYTVWLINKTARVARLATRTAKTRNFSRFVSYYIALKGSNWCLYFQDHNFFSSQ